MSKFKEAVEVMERIDASTKTNEGKMLVKGTILMEGENTIRSSFNNTTTIAISRSLFPFTDVCNNCIRTVDPTNKINFITLNFASREIHHEIMLAPDRKFQAIVVQEHPIRDLRMRSSKEQKELKGYRRVQKNLFFPSLDGAETPQK